MQYKVNPVSNEELREVARKMYAVLDRIDDPASLNSAEVRHLMEDIAISKIELEMQNEHLQNTRSKLELALTHAAEIFDFASVALFCVDATGCISKVNFQGARMLSTERAKLMGRKFAELFAIDQRSQITCWLSEEALLADAGHHTIALQDTELPVKQVQMHVSHLSHGHGVLITLSDMTEQWLLSHRITLLQDQFKLLSQIAGDGVWSWDVLRSEASYSEQLTRLYGFDVEEFGKTVDAWRDRIHPEDRSAFLHASQDCIAGKKSSFSCVQRVLCRNGNWKWIECRGLVQTLELDGTARSLYGIHIDITAQRQMELHQQEVVSELETTLASFPDRLALLNAEGTLLRANAAWAPHHVGSHFANSMPSLIGHDARLRQQIASGIADVLAGKRSSFKLTYRRGPTHAHRCYLMQCVPVNGIRIRAMVLHQDITPIQRMLARSQEEASFFEHSQEQFNRARRNGQAFSVIAVAWKISSDVAEEPHGTALEKVVKHMIYPVRQRLRGSDLIGPMGCDVFAVILPDTALSGAEVRARRLLDQIMEKPVNIYGTSLSITACVGVCQLQDDASILDLLKRAETAARELQKSADSGVAIDTQSSPSL